MKPQDYSARAAYRPPAAWYRRLNHVGVPLTSLGWAPRDAVTLEVRGRASGRARRVPILRTAVQGADYLVSLSGESQWVRNVRAADGAATIRRRGAHRVRLVEVPAAQRPEIIAAYLVAGRRRSGDKGAAGQARFYFGLDADASLDEIGEIAVHYPVFRVDYLDRAPGRCSLLPIGAGIGWWGATAAERAMAVPGDDLISRPVLQVTHAMTFRARPDQVWPWMVQLGHGRAGFYADSPLWDRCVDRYYRLLSRERAGRSGTGYRGGTDDRIVPEWQDPRVGDVVADGPPGTAHYVVRRVVPPSEWVLSTDTHLPYLLPRRLREHPRLGVFGEVTEGVRLTATAADRTRLVRRTRVRCGPWPFTAVAVPTVLIWGEAVTARRFLHGIRRRAEAQARAEASGAPARAGSASP